MSIPDNVPLDDSRGEHRMIITTKGGSPSARIVSHKCQNSGRGAHNMMRDIRADWKHWSQVERILAPTLIGGVLIFAISTIFFSLT
jgi:hypothetical protein